jgi:hypothetical protein
MFTAIARGALVGLVLLSAACGGSAPTAATSNSGGPAVASPPATHFPALSGPSRTFTFDRDLTYRVSDYTNQSRFVLYDDGAFALQYLSLGNEYHGGYTELNGVITFQFEGWNSAGASGATGTLNDGSLTVQYNVMMQLSNFDNAVYVQKQ